MSTIITAAVIVFIAWVYRRSLPKPIPGIPHDPTTLQRPFGDLWEFLAYRKKNGEARRWFATKIRKLDSAIIQVSIKPFGKPIVIISDFRESHDLLVRRYKETERTDRSLHAFRHTIPEQMVALKTQNRSFRESRELMRDAMTTNFLKENSVPLVYTKAQLLVDVLAEKAHIAESRPVNIREDIDMAILDGIMALSFGFDEARSELCKNLQFLRSCRNTNHEKRKGVNDPVEFEHLPLYEENDATLALSRSVKLEGTFPILESWWRHQTPQLKRAKRIRLEFTKREITRALEQLESSEGRRKGSALEYLLQRDARKAKKEGHHPDPYRRKIFDEIMGYVFAGHDTTSVTLTNCVMYLRQAQAAQQKLRELMRSQYYATAAQEKRQPSSSEITDINAPYLDAVIEEVLRLSAPLQPITRLALQDMIILGHHIPRGTTIFNIINGPGYVEDTVSGPREQDRGEKSQSAREKDFVPQPEASMHLEQFLPERWIKLDDHGHTVFDKDAAPMLSFGGGVRGCFGKRLGYLQVRVYLVLLLWDFELFPPDDRNLTACHIVDNIVTGPTRMYVRMQRVDRKEI